jgi:magnesium-transporting ATPase (P-type)
VGIWHNHSVEEMILSVVALSVSMIPEGLPVVITLVLAMGVW